MENTRPILYGVADYATIRNKNGWFIDRTAKIRHLVTLDRRLNGNFHVLENLIAGGELTERLMRSFQARELTQKENFTSLLYWLGIATITGDRRGKTVFGIPNETLKELAAKMIPAAYADVHKIDERVFGINDGLVDFSFDGNWRPFVGTLSRIVKENFAVRDAVEGEKVVQSTLVALLIAAGGPYFVKHEREAGGGFYDIALEPQLLRWPDIAHAALIEMKYVKAGDPAPVPDELAKIRAAAIDQLDKYSSDPQLVAAWRLRGTGNGERGMGNGERWNCIVSCLCSTAASASLPRRCEASAGEIRQQQGGVSQTDWRGFGIRHPRSRACCACRTRQRPST